MRIIYILVSGFLAVLDLMVGMGVVYFVENWFRIPHQLSHYIIGSILGLLPDLDVIWMVWRHGRIGDENHHEFLSHRPIVMVPTITLLAAFLGGYVWALIAFVCLIWHYFHDSHPFGGGLAWLWPYSNLYYSLVWWVPAIRPENSIMATVDTQWGFAKQNYFRPSVRSVVELALASALMVLVLGDLWGYSIGAAFAAFEWLVVIVIWIIWSKLTRSGASRK